MSLPEKTWPSQKLSKEAVQPAQKECKAKQSQSLTTAASGPVIDYTRFEKWSTLVRVTAYVLRFINNLRTKKFNCTKTLSAEEVATAEVYWYRQVQK